MKDVVSIIVPVYNMEQYLERCVQSLQNQIYENIEIILVDDGSTDQTSSLCDRLEGEDHRISVIHRENGGLSSARKSGLDIAKGKYIAFVDADDYVDTEYVDKMYQAVQSEEADMVISGYYVEDKPVEWFQKNFGLMTREEALSTLATFSHGDNLKFVVMWNKLYKKEMLQHITFTEARIHEDEYMAHRVLGKCERIAVLPDALYHYCPREGSLSTERKNWYKKRYQALKAFEERVIYYRLNTEEYLANQMLNTFLKLLDYEYGRVSQFYREEPNSMKEKITFRFLYKKLWIKICHKNRNKLSVKQRIKYGVFALNRNLYWHMFKQI